MARFDEDEFYVEPRARQKPSRRKAVKSPDNDQGPARRKPGRMLAIVLFAGIVIGIIANATLMQGARHPAPLFAGATPASVPAAPASVASQPPPKQTDAAPAHAAPTPATLTGLIKATAGARDQSDVSAAPRKEPKDPIAALLRGEPSPEKPGRIAAVQRALLKVGFTVHADGALGAGTRQAIERFERDRGLPETGDLSPRTIRELSAQSGVAIP